MFSLESIPPRYQEGRARPHILILGGLETQGRALPTFQTLEQSEQSYSSTLLAFPACNQSTIH